MLVKLLSTSIIAGTFLVGCGGEATVQDEQVASMPHQIDMTPKNSREFDPVGEDYLNFMKTYNLNSRIFYIRNGSTHLNDFNGRNQDLHYVFYYDSDHDKNTGYYDPWVPNAGADYLYEHDTLYRYTGTPGSHEWSWEVVGYELNEDDPDHSHGFLNVLGYGVSLNQDWTQNKFLGYSNTATNYLEVNFSFTEDTDRYVSSTQDDDTFYLHSYKIDKQKLDTNEKYYNYTFTVNNTIYHTQGNILFNQAWEVLADNLMYEVREYDTVTVVPKEYLVDGNLKISDMEVRDTNWNQIHSVSGGTNVYKVTNKEQLKDIVRNNGVDVTNIDVSAITDMSELFEWDYSFNQDIGNWNVSNVTNMSSMFYDARSFNQDLSGWDVSNVINYTSFSNYSPLQENYLPNFR